MTNPLHAIASRAENFFDRIRPSRDAETLHLQAYHGYATPTELVLRGRAMLADPTRMPDDTPTLIENLAAMTALFLTKEVAGVEVSAAGGSAVSDEEGYYELRLPRGDVVLGWSDVNVRANNASALHPVFVAGPDAPYGIISDIDDTVMHTSAWSTRSNLWTSLTGNVNSRAVFPDAAALLTRMQTGTVPAYFVSSSPWNMHGFLDAVFARAGVPRAPKFLRDYGVDEAKFIKSTHGSHKSGAIDTILAAHPATPFYLIGDSGQHDPVVYRDAAIRHPGRIKGVFIRTPGPGLGEEDRLPLVELRDMGVPIFAGETFEPLLDNAF